MMKYLFMILFLIPLMNYWWLTMLCYMMIAFMFVNMNYSMNFLSMISGVFSIDVLSYSMLSLTCWILFLMIMASYIIYKKNENSTEFLFMMIFMMLSLFLTFSADNMIIFYLSFEMSIIPTLFLIFGWGYQPERLLAGYYLIFYTLFASLPMLIGIFYIFNDNFTLNFWFISIEMNIYLYLSMILAFLVKMPMVFVHFWLPKAHVEAPISGSMILAGIMLKLGGYGLFRVGMFLSNYSVSYTYIWVSISLYGAFMVGLLCLCQTDIKSMIAYSSVAHMAMVICGIMSYMSYGLLGSLILMVGHGFCSSGLFCLANIIYERTHSRSFIINKGLINIMPSLSLLWFLLCSSNMASPPSLNLLGEIYIINTMVGWDKFTFLLLMMISFFSCCYSIYLYSFTQHGFIYSGLYFISSGTLREYFLIMLHWIPLNFLILKFDLFSLYF
uniref:NADH-ubiquinone oxidoreductase chain 4 n=1 Tax=Tessaratoma papillosa TaxID=236711 RepID=A0A343W8Z9_9HEMI|nr:NADH dehydrogenase subunit 4 [Tessaratoma papillosa]AVZ00839.1 NADH dehydrogenase subunit 4 [Tessaratoma papillosa]